MERRRVLVSGRVQGVFFRAACARLARSRGLGGYVRNLPNGDVEAAFEGEEADVEAMVAWCREGPDLASVERIEVEREPPTGEASFRVAG